MAGAPKSPALENADNRPPNAEDNPPQGPSQRRRSSDDSNANALAALKQMNAQNAAARLNAERQRRAELPQDPTKPPTYQRTSFEDEGPDGESFQYDEEWMKSFQVMKIFLMIFGRWPLTYTRQSNRRGYAFRFSWICPGFIIFVLTTLFTLYGLIAGGINVVDVLMKEKISAGRRSNTEIFEQALAERHTMILIVVLGSFGINTITTIFIMIKRHEIADMLTRWTRFLQTSKLSGGTLSTYSYVGLAFTNYLLVCVVFFGCCFSSKEYGTATFVGGPTVVAMLFMRHFNPHNYLDNFVGSPLHFRMHLLGMVILFYVVTSCNAFMYFFLWLIKSVENSISCWNARMADVLEFSAEEIKTQTSTKSRTTYEKLYHDHIGLTQMLSWCNNAFAYSIEPYVLFLTVKIVYQLYLAAIVIETNGKPLITANVGKYFIRRNDHLPALLLTYENCFMALIMLLASSWLEDTAYDSYEDLRRKSLLKGTYGDRESYFFLSMFQSYTSTTKMAIYGGQFFCIDRYSILHVISAIMSNFLVVYQFRPLFDMDTVGAEFDELRRITGEFFEAFEGLPPEHYKSARI